MLTRTVRTSVKSIVGIRLAPEPEPLGCREFRLGAGLKILIVDDHALFREGLKLLLTRHGSETTVFDAGSVEEGLALAAAQECFDLLLLDINLPGCRGLDGLRLFRQALPATAVILLSGINDQPLIREGLARGARGFIHKSVTANVMLAQIDQVLAGGICHAAAAECAGTSLPGNWGCMAPPQLTPRQREVLARLCEGMSNKEIGRELGMSDNTVRVHVAGIFRILGVRSRTEAAVLAHRAGLIN